MNPTIIGNATLYCGVQMAGASLGVQLAIGKAEEVQAAFESLQARLADLINSAILRSP